MAKYHINGKGEPGLCRAKQKCPFGDLTEDHYASKQEARSAYEQRRSPASPPTALSKEKLTVEAQKASRIGAYRSLQAIREFTDEEYGQAEFDATLTGKLSLQRRLLGEKYSKEEYLQRQEAAETAEYPLPPAIEYPPHEGWGGGSFHSTLQDSATPRVFYKGQNRRKDEERLLDQYEITRLSEEWMNKLNPEEQEAVSWMTSNGSAVLLSHLHGTEHELWGYKVYSKELLDRTNEAVRSATQKGVKLEEPMMLYRGVNMNDAISDFDPRKLWKPGEKYTVGTPESSSVDPGIARSHTSFQSPVIYEYEVKTFCPTACVSAWRSSELEALVPYKEFECVDIQENVTFGDGAAYTVAQFREI